MKILYIQANINEIIDNTLRLQQEAEIFLDSCKDEDIENVEVECVLFCEDVIVKDMTEVRVTDITDEDKRI